MLHHGILCDTLIFVIAFRRESGYFFGRMSAINTELVREDGTVEDQLVETFYTPLVHAIPADGYVRFIGDNDATHVEVRVPFETLRLLGWSNA
jgi:hypothetical protein